MGAHEGLAPIRCQAGVSPYLLQAQEREQPGGRGIHDFGQAEARTARDVAHRKNGMPAEHMRETCEAPLGCRAHAPLAAEMVDDDRRAARPRIRRISAITWAGSGTTVITNMTAAVSKEQSSKASRRHPSRRA